MIPDSLSRSSAISPKRAVYAALFTLLPGLFVAVLVAKVTMAPETSELFTLAGYLSLTGAAAAVVGWIVLGQGRIAGRLSLRGKAFVGAGMGGLLGLLNVLVIARLMFVSTSHDLWVLASAVSFSIAVMAAFALLVAASIADRVALIAGAVRTLASDEGDAASVPFGDEVSRLAYDIEHLSRRLEAAEIERRRIEDERKGLTAAISHDLRTPVANVRAMAEALGAGVLEEEADKQSYVELMQREIERLSRMIDDLFDLAQLDSGAFRLDLKALQLEEIVADVVHAMDLQARQRGLSLTFNVERRDLPCSLVDGARIERVIANLVRNAIEHTPPGGQVRLTLGADDDWLTLSITDTGNGFDEAHRERIWERFYRLDTSRGRRQSQGDGAGLGLAIVRGLVEAHGGRVSARSQVGLGSTFTVQLPAVDTA